MPTPLSFLRAPVALRSTYTALAPLYDDLVPWVSSRPRAMGLSWLDVQDGEQVLDLGTGTGLALPSLVAATPTGWTEGVDGTPAMLHRARRRLRNSPHTRYGLRRAQATDLPYPDTTFDAVFSAYLVDVLPTEEIRPVLEEMRRVLRPHGRLVVVYLAPPRRSVERLWSGFAHVFPPLLGGGRPLYLRPLLRTSGFAVQAHTTCSQGGLRSAITLSTLS